MESILYKFLGKCPQICNAIIINKYSFLGRLGFVQNIFWPNTNFRYWSTSSCHLLDVKFLHLQLAQRIAQSSPDRTRVIAVRPNYELCLSAVSSWWSLKSLGKVFFENWDFFDQCWSVLIVLNKKNFQVHLFVFRILFSYYSFKTAFHIYSGGAIFYKAAFSKVLKLAGSDVRKMSEGKTKLTTRELSPSLRVSMELWINNQGKKK